MNRQPTAREVEIFGRMPIKDAIRTMAVPTIISQLVSVIYNIADSIFIGRAGDPMKTAGVTVASTVFFMTVALSNLCGVGSGSQMARLAGEGKQSEAKKVCAFGVYSSFVVSLAYAVLIGAFLNPLLYLMGASEDTILFGRQYLMMVIVLGGVPTIMSVTFAHLLRNSGHAREASIGLSGGGILNMLLDPLFMFVILPDGMEVLGAGIATCLSNVIAFIFLGTVLYRASKNGPLSMRLSDARRIRPQDFRQFFAVGIPAFSLTGLFDLAAIVLNALMAGHGDLQVAAIGIVMKAERLPTAINIGLCQGMLPIVAFNSTSGDRKRMEAVISYVRKLGVMISLIAIVLFQIFAVPLCGVFMSTSLGNGEKAAATLVFAATFLHIRCLVSPFQFLNYHTSHCLQAVGAGRETMLHALMRELVFYIPMMFIFNKLFGLYGLVASIITGEACGALTALALLNRWKRQHPV